MAGGVEARVHAHAPEVFHRVAEVCPLPVEDAGHAVVDVEEVADAGVAVEDRDAVDFVGHVAPEPMDAERGEGLDREATHLVPDRLGVRECAVFRRARTCHPVDAERIGIQLVQRAEELDVLLEEALLGVGVGVLDFGFAFDPVVDRGPELGAHAVHAGDVEPLLAEQRGEACLADDDVDAVGDVVVATRAHEQLLLRAVGTAHGGEVGLAADDAAGEIGDLAAAAFADPRFELCEFVVGSHAHPPLSLVRPAARAATVRPRF